MTDLGTLFGGYGASEAYAINNNGQVVGYSAGQGFSYSNGLMKDLGTVGNSYPATFPHAINERGVIVGYFAIHYPYPDIRAFRYGDGQAQDLNSLVPNSGWILNWAYGINDAGQIVGAGTIIGQTQKHAFLMTPVH